MQLGRTPKSLSYTSLGIWEANPEEFYLKYLAGTRAPRLKQENFMAVGSAFDAYVKSEMHAILFGEHSDPEFEFDTIFEAQVEPHNRDFALKAGQVCLNAYKYSGAYDELLDLLRQSVEPVQFEKSVEGYINGVPWLGKPDCRFALRFRDVLLRIILDWKCLGYCSKSPPSPSKGFRLCRDGFPPSMGKKTKANPEGKPSATHNTEHGNYLAYDHHGLTINAGYMEGCSQKYADQVSTYGWILGEKPGDENVVVFIDELVAKTGDGDPLIRVANHRARVGRDHQLKLVSRIEACWNAIQTGHIFRDMDRADNDARCEQLEDVAIGLQSETEDDEWCNALSRPHRY